MPLKTLMIQKFAGRARFLAICSRENAASPQRQLGGASIYLSFDFDLRMQFPESIPSKRSTIGLTPDARRAGRLPRQNSHRHVNLAELEKT
jgi:hypothetical protein